MRERNAIDRHAVPGRGQRRGHDTAAASASRAARDGWRLGGALALPAVAALVTAWIMPRGPVTTAEALGGMAGTLLLGTALGWLSGRRWSLLLGPVVFAAVFELARIGVDGPTVDLVHLGAMYGIIAFVLGRVVPAVLLLGPMVVGTAVGLGLARRLRTAHATGLGPVGWTFTGLAALGLAALAIAIARPASTSPILGADGGTLAGSVAELVRVPIGGHDQALMIRGRDVRNPVLLYLTGGPGGTDLGAMRRDVSLEQDFTVVVWDQRGSGKSYGALDPTGTLTVQQFVDDTIDVTHYLRERFHRDAIYLVGQSWGSTLGVLAVQQHPELYRAYVGVGQMVSQRATDVMFWEDTMAWAEANGNTGLVRTLRRNGPPPYANVLNYDPIVTHEHDWNAYPEFDGSNEMPGILFVPEYTFMDRINAFRGFLDVAGTIYPQLQAIDFRQSATRLAVPVTMILGEHEARGRAELANEWFASLEAPAKQTIVFDGAGHRAHFDDPARFAGVMRDLRASLE